MISDVLSEAADRIEEFLAMDTQPYGKPGTPLYDEIADLVIRMKRMRVKLDSPDYNPDRWNSN